MIGNEIASTENFSDITTERNLLSSLLLKDGLIIPKIAAVLKTQDFSSKVHQMIYEAILDLHNRGVVPNMLLIKNELESTKIFTDNQLAFMDAITDLGNLEFTTANSDEYVRIIKEKSARRKLKYYGEMAINAANNLNFDLQKSLVLLENGYNNILDKDAEQDLLSPSDYFNQFITGDIAENKLYADRKTGFDNIDLHQIFSPGLYVVGATPACGKTTFCWQLLNQLAVQGEFCIFCSYEMSRLELYSKTLARELFLRNRQTTLTAADIRRGGTSPELEDLIIEFATTKDLKGAHLFQFRNENIDDLIRRLKPYCSNKEKSPVVCLDYLQIVPPSDDKKLTTDKAKIDDIVHKLKTFQRETNTTFIVVSSFNRANYAQQVSFESFKESGNIEYTADVIWALQLNVVNELKAANISDSRKMFDDAKKHQPRQIQLKCLKNRQGQNYDCYFNYYSAHDYFQTCKDFENIDESSDNSEFVGDNPSDYNSDVEEF